MKVVTLVLVMFIACAALAQSPVPCPVINSAEDSITCLVAQVAYLRSIDASVFKAISTRFVTDESIMTQINANQVSAQQQISSFSDSAQQLVKDSAALQGQMATAIGNDLNFNTRLSALETKVALLPNLTPGPLISVPVAVPSTGAATITWTNYVPGNAVIKWSLVAGATNANSAWTFPLQSGMSYKYTITAPSKTTITYWVQVNSPEGWSFVGSKNTITVQ